MKPYIYLRGLRHVEHSVFCVSTGQKTYYDPIFGRELPYSSGQQVKRSIFDSIGESLGQERSPVTFVFKGHSLEEGEVFSICDPKYYDQLLGGWMRTSEIKENEKNEEKKPKTKTIKRRSPFSISAMRPLHPLLGKTSEENMTFDRSDKTQIPNKILLKEGKKCEELSSERIEELVKDTGRSFLRKWLKPSDRATGLFVYDVAIDLRTLFCVSINEMEPEISKEKIEELQAKGWISSENVFGKCLVMPKEEREKVIPAIAKALINWRITSNQARTFSLMETLAVAISDNANTLAGTIYAKLSDENKAIPIIRENKGSDLFVTLPCSGYVVTENESADALQKAEERLIELLSSFDYENQVE